MALLSRVWEALPGVKARKKKSDGVAKIILGDMDGSVGNAGTSRMDDFKDYLGAITIPNVYAAASVIAYAAANLPMDVVDENDDPVENLDTLAPDLAALLKQPNPVSDQFHFREQQVYDVLLTGNNIVAKDTYSAEGLPTELWRLRPDRVRVMFEGGSTTERTLTYALLNTNSGGSQVAQRYDAEDILHWRTANPQDPIWGLGIIEAGEVAFSTNRALNDMIRAYFERGAVLDGVIILPQEELSQQEYDRLINRWKSMRQRGRASLRTGVLTGNAKYQNVQEPLGQMPVVQLKEMARNEVLELFGVPPAKLGDFKGSNWRNAQEANAFFYSETVTPLLRRLEYGWTALVRLWNPTWKVRFRIPDLAADFGARAEAAAKLSTTNAIRRNEIREKAGFDPLPKEDWRGNEIVNTSTAARQAPELVGGQNDPQPTAAPSAMEEAAQRAPSSVEREPSGNEKG